MISSRWRSTPYQLSRLPSDRNSRKLAANSSITSQGWQNRSRKISLPLMGGTTGRNFDRSCTQHSRETLGKSSPRDRSEGEQRASGDHLHLLATGAESRLRRLGMSPIMRL